MDETLRRLGEQLPLIRALLTTRLSQTLFASAAFLLVVQYGYYAIAILQSKDLILPQGPVIGGDFVVFWQAAQTPIAEIPEIYDFAEISRRLERSFPAYGEFSLGWHYPPTVFFLFAPFAGQPYLASYAAWCVFLLLFLLVVLRGLGADRRALFFVAASPAVFQAVITGQTGFFVAGLFALAAFAPNRRPLIAGLAAGVLTLKPQLGILLPIAFLAAGAWRAIFVAGATAIAIVVSAWFVFGVEAYAAFFDELSRHGGRLSTPGFPFHKLTSAYGGLVNAGVPYAVAGAVQTLTTLGVAVFVFFAWRRTDDPELRLAAAAGGVLLATPYGFYYDLPMLIAPMLIVAKRGLERGWLPHERAFLCVLWIAPMFMPAERDPAVSEVFLVSVSAFALVVRRVAHETGFAEDFRFANANAPAPAG
ncbi:MAG: glycosyltransferase family 87 protein [Parvularculaceae bacterium]